MPIFEGSFKSKALKDFYYKGTAYKLPVVHMENDKWKMEKFIEKNNVYLPTQAEY